MFIFKIKKGFTIIEILVTIAIIGVLSTMVILALNNARVTSRDAKKVSDLSQISKALDLYYANNNSYPTTLTPGEPLVDPEGIVYMESIPSNTKADGDCEEGDYVYNVPTGQNNPRVYVLTTCLGSSSGPYNAGLTPRYAAGIFECEDIIYDTNGAPYSTIINENACEVFIPPSLLDNLVVSGSPFNYSFSSNTYTYNEVNVLNGVSSVTVTPTGVGSITVDGSPVNSGSPSSSIALTPWIVRPIEVTVAEDGKVPTTYTVNLTRRGTIGSSHGGGYVAYIDGSGIHGFIVSTVDISTTAPWGCVGLIANLILNLVRLLNPRLPDQLLKKKRPVLFYQVMLQL